MKNYLKKFSLKGKIAFVTGGAGLLGTEVTNALADAGAHVVILEIDQKSGELQKKLQGEGKNISFVRKSFENIKSKRQKSNANY